MPGQSEQTQSTFLPSPTKINYIYVNYRYIKIPPPRRVSKIYKRKIWFQRRASINPTDNSYKFLYFLFLYSSYPINLPLNTKIKEKETKREIQKSYPSKNERYYHLLKLSIAIIFQDQN